MSLENKIGTSFRSTAFSVYVPPSSQHQPRYPSRAHPPDRGYAGARRICRSALPRSIARCPAAGCRSARCTRCWAPGPTRKTALLPPLLSPESWPGSAADWDGHRSRRPSLADRATASMSASAPSRFATLSRLIRYPALCHRAASPILSSYLPPLSRFPLSPILPRKRRRKAQRTEPGRGTPGRVMEPCCGACGSRISTDRGCWRTGWTRPGSCW